MEVTFVNVGYGEAIVLRRGDTTVVVDGGSDRDSVYRAPGTIRLADYLARENIRRIDLAVVTHLHEDHLCGLLPVIETLPVGEIRMNVLPQGDTAPFLERIQKGCAGNLSRELYFAAWQSYGALCKTAKSRHIPLKEWTGDGRETEFGGLVLRPFGMDQMRQNEIRNRLEAMLAETDSASLFRALDENDSICNGTSLALMAYDGRGAALLSGDKVGGWDAIAAQHDLHANILKATHHGQIDGLPEAMLQGADPDAVVICADAARTWNSARPEVIERVRALQQAHGKAPCVYVTGEMMQNGAPGCAVSFSVTPEGNLDSITVSAQEK